ncbi:MAG: desulfoferrodoxin family protein [bacterium]
MRKVLIAVAAVVLFANTALAHPPLNVDIKQTKTMINVTVNHPVGDPKTHYIGRIEVMVNDNKVITQRFFMQTGNVQIAVYNIPSIKKGDKLMVRAYCNKSGDLTNMIQAK